MVAVSEVAVASWMAPLRLCLCWRLWRRLGGIRWWPRCRRRQRRRQLPPLGWKRKRLRPGHYRGCRACCLEATFPLGRASSPSSGRFVEGSLSLVVHRPSSRGLEVFCYATAVIYLSTPLGISWDIESSGDTSSLTTDSGLCPPRGVSITCPRVEETRRCGSRLKKPLNDFTV